MRRVFAVVAITASVFAVRFAVADSGSAAFGLKWMESQTGVVMPDWYVRHPWLAVGLDGDGLVYVSQTVDPFGWDGHTSRLATAGYRFTRIGYPLAAKAATFGVDDLAPVGLFVLSTVGVALSAWTADRMRDRWGPSAWLLVANPATLIGYVSGTAEPLALGLAALALTKGPGWGAAMAAVRPDLLPALIRRPRAFGAGAVAAAVVWLGGWGLYGSVHGGHNLTVPLGGYLAEATISGSVLALIAATVVSAGIWRQDWSWLLSGLLVLMFAAPVLENPVNAWRTSGMLWLVLAAGYSTRRNQSIAVPVGSPERLLSPIPTMPGVQPTASDDAVSGDHEIPSTEKRWRRWCWPRDG